MAPRGRTGTVLVALFLLFVAPGCADDSDDLDLGCVLFFFLGVCTGPETPNTQVWITAGTTPVFSWDRGVADSLIVLRDSVEIWAIRRTTSFNYLSPPVQYGSHSEYTVSYTDSVPELTFGVVYTLVIKRDPLGDVAVTFTPIGP